MSEQDNEIVSTHDLIEQRRLKLTEWRETGKAYPSGFRRDALAADLLKNYNAKTEAELAADPIHVKMAGRIMTRRLMGKASFTHIQDMSGRMQLYVRLNDVTEEIYEAFKHWDLGDIIGVEGFLFKTKT